MNYVFAQINKSHHIIKITFKFSKTLKLHLHLQISVIYVMFMYFFKTKHAISFCGFSLQ